MGANRVEVGASTEVLVVPSIDAINSINMIVRFSSFLSGYIAKNTPDWQLPKWRCGASAPCSFTLWLMHTLLPRQTISALVASPPPPPSLFAVELQSKSFAWPYDFWQTTSQERGFVLGTRLTLYSHPHRNLHTIPSFASFVFVVCAFFFMGFVFPLNNTR